MTTYDRPSFEFGGRLSLDFTWTLRYRSVHPTELLAAPDDLRAWLVLAGLPAGRVAPITLTSARELREAIHAAAIDTIERRQLRTKHLEVINRWAAAEHASARLHPDGTATLQVRKGREAAAGLTAVASDAIQLLSLADHRIRRCEGPRCSLLFHDTSRPGTRRWCATQRCGNKVNTRSYRERSSRPVAT